MNREERESRRPDSPTAQAAARIRQDLDERGTTKWDAAITDNRSLQAWKANLPNRH